jgi:2-methylisocitrate lyase-like PEP mutase family enzyme
MEYEAAGCAAIQLEDQETPKKCGHMEGKKVIPTLEHCHKIEMAKDTRKDMLILARSDARATHGIEEAIKRVNEYAKAGADFACIDAPATVDELKMIADQVTVPVMLNQVEGGKTPVLPLNELQALGLRGIICYPAVCPLTIIRSLKSVLVQLLQDGTTLNVSKDKIGVMKDHTDLCGLPFYKELEKKYVQTAL